MRRRSETCGESAAGRWQAVESTPGQSIRRFVRGNFIGWTESADAPILRREIPVCFVPVIVNFAQPFMLGMGEAPQQSQSSFVAGASDRYALVRSGDRTCCLQLNLTYDGALRLFRLPMKELSNRTVSLNDVLGREGKFLIERLGNAANWEERFDLIDAFLQDRLLAHPGLSSETAAAFAALEKPVQEIAADLGINRKRLIAHFNRDIGLPPKTIAQIRRFNRAAAMLRHRRDLAAVALDCGYYDQSHFNRDFRMLAGITPLQYAAESAVRPQ